MTIATFAIAGLPPFAGFFSKDRILWSAWSSGAHVLWVVGAITAGMTSFYMFRLWFLTFFGEYRGPNPETGGHGQDTDAQHAGHAGAIHDAQDAHAAGGSHGHGAPHESPWVMVIPLVLLALLSLGGGWMGIPHSLRGGDQFGSFLSPVIQSAGSNGASEMPSAPTPNPAQEESTSMELTFTGISVGIAFLGLFLAWLMYYKNRELPARFAKAMGGFYQLVLHKYKIDELYGAVIIQPIIALSTNVFWKGIDRGLIDGAVDGGAAGAQETSDALRHMQSGNIRSYAGWVAVGATAVIVFMVWRGLR
jgi:NADH-quinone oxidoreductase subunit L